MATLELRNVNKTYGAGLPDTLKNIELSIKEGEFLILVGPSGCGKSTLMNCIAGLETITGGAIMIGDQDVSGMSPKDRDIAMVFQSYALYPTMSVRENIEFGLKIRKMPQADIDAEVARVAKLLQIEHLLNRKPGQLSGGQQQRVAMGRALARRPKIYLFDEPLSNLDAKLRVEMRTEMKLMHQRLKTTTVYVTHDQIEAMTMADRIVVMKGGVVEQIGKPLELYDQPANLFVATFIGSPAMNLIKGKAGSGGFVAEGGAVLPLPPGAKAGAVTYGIRPEHLTLDESGFRAEVVVVEPTGAETQVLARFGTTMLVVVLRERVELNPGDSIGLRPDLSTVHLFGEDGRRL